MARLLNIPLALAGALLFSSLTGLAPYAGSVWSVVLLAALLLLLHRAPAVGADWRKTAVSHLGGGCFALLLAFGSHLGQAGQIPWSDGWLWVAVLCYTHLLARVLLLLWQALTRTGQALQKPAAGRWAQVERALGWFFGRPWLVLPVLVAFWLPCWLATWPGNFVYDATKEFGQLQTGFLGDLPMLHSVLITGLLDWSIAATGSANMGIALFTGGQLLLVVAIFSHMLWRFTKLGANRFLVAALGLYCAAFPGIHVLVTSTVRDVLFSALLTYSVFLLWNICRDRHRVMASWWRPLGAAPVLVLTVLSRNNNAGLLMPLALVAVAALLFAMGGKRGWRGAVSFAALALACWLGLNGALQSLCAPLSQPSRNASLTFYAHTLGRAYTLEGEGWTGAEKQKMAEFYNMKGFRYVAENGDSTKGRLRLESEEELREFKAFWAEMGARYPGHYADAHLLNTRAMWYPGAPMRGYQQAGVKMYAGYEKCWFFYADIIEEPGVLDSRLPALHDWYRDLSLMTSFEKVPVVSQLFSVGFHFWLLLFALFYALYRRQRQLYLPLAILVGYMVASSFVPLMLLRYFGAVFFAFPLVCMFILQPGLGKPLESTKKQQ